MRQILCVRAMGMWWWLTLWRWLWLACSSRQHDPDTLVVLGCGGSWQIA